jgi:YVTN family beta-propeller protein
MLRVPSFSRHVVTLAALLAAASSALDAQTYRMNAFGDLSDRPVRIIQTNSAGTMIHIFDPKRMELVGIAEDIQVPHGVALSHDGRSYYVTNEHDNTVDVVDTRTLKVTERIQLAQRPNNLSSSDRARKVYVAITGAPLIQVIDQNTNRIIKDIPTVGGMHNTFVTPDGRYAVGGAIGSSEMIAIDTQTDAVIWSKIFPFTQGPFTGGVRPFAFTTNPDGSTKWILVNIGGFHGMWVVDWQTQEVLRRISPPDETWNVTVQTGDGIQSATSHGVVVLPDQSAVWISSRGTSHVYGWSLPDFRYLGKVYIGNPAWLTATPDSRQLWVGVSSHSETAVVDVQSMRVVKRFPVGNAPKRIYTAVFPANWQGETATLANANPTPRLDFVAFRERVEPILLRPRGGFVAQDASCVACHAHQTTTPLELQTPSVDNGRVLWTEAQSRLNFAAVARLVDPNDVANSRLLKGPLAPEAGGRGHSGGIFWNSTNDPEYRAIADWVRAAAGAPSPPAPPTLDFAFFRGCVQPIFVNPRPGAVACTQCHNAEFARPIPQGQQTWSEQDSRRAFTALMNYIDPGHPEYSRFLHKPLHPDAGGDLMHNGGRRWMSKDDAEWRAVAAWIRGDATGSTCPPALRFPNAAEGAGRTGG